MKAVRDSFNGVMDDLAETLLDSNRPNLPHLTNCFDDWQQFGFRNLAVESAAWRDNLLVLVLSVDDLAAAARGLEKYGKRWEALCRKWFGCEVEVEWVQSAPYHAPIC